MQKSHDSESFLSSQEWLHLRRDVLWKVAEQKAELPGLQQPQQRARFRPGSASLDELDGAFRESGQVGKFLTRKRSRNASELESFTDGCGHGFFLQRALCYSEQTNRSEAYEAAKGATP